MKKTSKPIVFFGNERIATGVHTTAPTLKSLIHAGYDVKAVVANFTPSKSRNARQLEVIEVAKEHDIPVLLPKRPIDIIEQLRELKAEIGVLVAYGRIVPQAVIDIFPLGIINIHPSLLPKHRGPTPIESVIRHGETNTGVSIMGLVQAMDAGPIYAQEVVAVNDTISKQALADQLIAVGAEMVLKTLPSIFDNSLQPAPQQDSGATYDQLISKQDGEIQWQKSAKELAREIRAYQTWPGSRTTLFGKELTVLEATAAAEDGSPGTTKIEHGAIRVYCGEGSLLVTRIKPNDKNAMDATAFIAGIQTAR